MGSRNWITAVVAVAATLLVCRDAHANSMSTFVVFFPGTFYLDPVYAFPASVLAAIVERPFLARAGIRHGALALSLRANLLSAIVGVLLIPVGYVALFLISLGWCFVSVCISCMVELWHLGQWLPHPPKGNRAANLVILGNLVSSAVLFALPMIVIEAVFSRYEKEMHWYLGHRREEVAWLAVGVSLAIFLGSFLCRVKNPSEILGDPTESGGLKAESPVVGSESSSVAAVNGADVMLAD